MWYFHRSFCPACGTDEPVVHQASGTGTVHASTLVARAPTEELRAHAPYLIVLVDADEGFRLMAHGDPDLQIGDRVRRDSPILPDERFRTSRRQPDSELPITAKAQRTQRKAKPKR